MQEHDFNISDDSDLVTYKEAISTLYSNFWLDAMEDEMKSMASNGVWDLVELLDCSKLVGCKWVFKSKRDSNNQVESPRFVTKGFSKKEGIDYIETFSLVSTKDSFRIIMVIMAHYDLELHKMNVKTAFLNGDLFEDVYMVQLVGFKQMGNGDLVRKLKRSIYGLKQASRQWYIKFDEVIIRNSFKENVVDRCIYIYIYEG